MIAPERWYEYQRDYQRYGLDMKPQPERKMRSQRKRRTKKVTISAGNAKKLAFSSVLTVGIAMIVLIIVTAYSAGIRCEIENLQVKIYSANNIDYIEGKATGELGMTYPSSDSCVYLTSDDLPEPGFADIIKENAYN